MSRRPIIITTIVLLSICAAAAVCYVLLRPSHDKGEGEPAVPEQTETGTQQPHVISTDSASRTNAIIVFEDEFSADPQMVGKWQNTENKGWYQVFYDDYDDENFFWGKEWDETDDVMEEDLRYHGNGWFRWRKDGKVLLEVSVQDQHSGDIPHEYTIRRLSDDVLELEECDGRRRTYRFTKAD